MGTLVSSPLSTWSLFCFINHFLIFTKWSNAHKLPLWLKSPSGSISSVTLMLNASFLSVWQRVRLAQHPALLSKRLLTPESKLKILLLLRTQLSAPRHHHQQHHLQKWPAASNSLKKKTLTSRKLPMSSVPWCSAWTRASNHLKVPNLLPQLLTPLPSHQS